MLRTMATILPVKVDSTDWLCTLKVMVPTVKRVLGPPVPTPSMSASLEGSLVEHPKSPDHDPSATQLPSMASTCVGSNSIRIWKALSTAEPVLTRTASP